MNIDFAGNELEAFIPSGPNVNEGNTAGSFNSAIVRGAIRVSTTTSDYIDTPVTTTRTTSWTHFDFWPSSASVSGSAIITKYNASGVAVFRIATTAVANVYQAQYWSGSAWVNIGSSFTCAHNVRHTLDVKLVCGSSGSFEVWSGGTLLLASGSADMSAVDNVAKRRFHNVQSNTTAYSQVIVSDLPTIGHFYYNKAPTGNGANTGWTGDFSAVDEATLSQTDFIESTAAGQIETFTGPAVTIPTGVVKAVVVSGQLKNSATGPQNAQGCLRKGGVNYFSGNIPGITVGYQPGQAVFHNDPATGVGWTLSDAGAATLEFGFRSAA